LAREVAYQTVGNGLTKYLKEAKKSVWPPFPIHCGVFTLENFRHATLEISHYLTQAIQPAQESSKCHNAGQSEAIPT